jgi:hypothetical protein
MNNLFTNVLRRSISRRVTSKQRTYSTQPSKPNTTSTTTSTANNTSSATSKLSAKQIRRELLRGNKVTKIASVASVLTFAGATGYYLYDWGNTPEQRERSVARMLSPDASSEAQLEALLALYAGSSSTKRTFSGRVVLESRLVDQIDHVPRVLALLALPDLDEDARELALAWLSRVSHNSKTAAVLIAKLGGQGLTHLAHLAMPTEQAKNSSLDDWRAHRTWILAGQTLVNLSRTHAQELAASAEVLTAIDELARVNLPSAALIGQQLNARVKNSTQGSSAVDRALLVLAHEARDEMFRHPSVNLARALRSRDLSETPQERHVTSELLVRSVRHVRSWYHTLMHTTDSSVPRHDHVLNSHSAVYGANLVNVLTIGVLGTLWGRVMWWLRGGVKAAASSAITLSEVAPLVKSRHVGTWLTVLLGTDLALSHVLRAASSNSLSFDFAQLPTLNELFPNLVKHLNEWSNVGKHVKQYEHVPMVNVFPIAQASIFTLGTLYLIRAQRYVVFPLCLALAWNQRDLIIGRDAAGATSHLIVAASNAVRALTRDKNATPVNTPVTEQPREESHVTAVSEQRSEEESADETPRSDE